MIWFSLLIILPLVFGLGVWVGIRRSRVLLSDISREWKAAGVETAADWLRDNTQYIIQEIMLRHPKPEEMLQRLARELEDQYL